MRLKFSIKHLLSLVLVASFIGVFNLTTLFDTTQDRQNICSSIYNETIPSKDVQLVYEMNKIRYAKLSTQALACQHLQKIIFYTKLLEELESSVTEQELYQEHRRIALHTQGAAQLAQLQKLFDGNFDDYLRLFILPHYVEKKLIQDVFPYNTKIHQNKRKSAEALLAKLYSQKLEDKTNTSYRLRKYYLSPSLGFYKEPKFLTKNQRPNGSLTMAKQWLEEVIPHLNPDGIYPSLIEQPEEFWIARKINEQSNGTFVFEVISIAKISFDSWLHQKIQAAQPTQSDETI